MHICGRAGHTKTSTGASAVINEVGENRPLFKRIKELLIEVGNKFNDVTPPESYAYPPELEYGIAQVNKYRPDIFFSIHFNSFNGAKGSEVCVYPNTKLAIDMGKRITKNLSDLGFYNRGVKDRTDLGELKNTVCPAMVIETCFVQDPDASLYKKLGVEKVARAIANGIDSRVSLNPPATSNPPANNSGELYRVRKSWDDVASQKGAYANLESAKALCDKNSGYSVYDSKGNKVYPITNSNSTSYTVKITGDVVNIRSGAGTNYPVKGTVKQGEVYTIVEEKNGFGKLKSGAGWISLEFTSKGGNMSKPVKILKVGSKVKITGSKYATGQEIPSWVKVKTYTVKELQGDKVLLQEIMSWVYKKDIEVL